MGVCYEAFVHLVGDRDDVTKMFSSRVHYILFGAFFKFILFVLRVISINVKDHCYSLALTDLLFHNKILI